MSLLQIAESVISTLLSAGITFFIGFIIARFTGKIMKIILHEADVDIFFRKFRHTFSAEDFAAKIIEFIVYAGTIAIVLNQLGILNWVLFLTLISIIIALLIASVLNLKEAVPNFFARLQMSKVKAGDKISINNLSGRIEYVGFFQTKIISKNNEIFWIPNLVVRRHFIQT